MNYAAVIVYNFFMSYCPFHLSTYTSHIKAILLCFSWAFSCGKREVKHVVNRILNFIKISRSWAMIIYCVKVFFCGKYSEKIPRKTFPKKKPLKSALPPLNCSNSNRSIMHETTKLNALIRSYWINLIIVWNGIQWEPIFSFWRFFIRWLAVWNELTNWKLLKTLKRKKSFNGIMCDIRSSV